MTSDKFKEHLTNDQSQGFDSQMVNTISLSFGLSPNPLFSLQMHSFCYQRHEEGLSVVHGKTSLFLLFKPEVAFLPTVASS